MAVQRTYPIEIVRDIRSHDLATCPAEEVDQGEDEGFYGNQHFRDLRDVTWDQVAEAVRAEEVLFQRFAEAVDLDDEAERLEEERGEALLDDEDYWGLDVGVIGATLALSALGCVTVSSCNAGGFGGQHVARFPHIAFFLPRELADQVLGVAVEADVGLDVIDGGLARLFGARDDDLHRFAQALLRRFGGRTPS